MDIEETRQGEIVILAPSGSLNAQTAAKLEQKLVSLLTSRVCLLVVDFKEVDYVASAALRVLLMVGRKLAPPRGRFVLCTMSEDVRKVFTISGFDRDFTIVRSRGEAVEEAAAAAVAVAEAAAKPESAPKSRKPAKAAAPDPTGRVAALAARLLASGEADEARAKRSGRESRGGERLRDLVLEALARD